MKIKPLIDIMVVTFGGSRLDGQPKFVVLENDNGIDLVVNGRPVDYALQIAKLALDKAATSYGAIVIDKVSGCADFHTVEAVNLAVDDEVDYYKSGALYAFVDRELGQTLVDKGLAETWD